MGPEIPPILNEPGIKTGRGIGPTQPIFRKCRPSGDHVVCLLTHLEAGAFLDDLKSAGEERMTGGGASRPGRVDAQGGGELQTYGEI